MPAIDVVLELIVVSIALEADSVTTVGRAGESVAYEFGGVGGEWYAQIVV